MSLQTSTLHVVLQSLSVDIPRYAVGIGAMCLFNIILYACVLGYIAVGQMHVRKLCLCLAIYCPPHNIHCSGISKRSATLYFQFKLSTMVCLMACLAKGNQVVWSITTRLSAF